MAEDQLVLIKPQAVHAPRRDHFPQCSGTFIRHNVKVAVSADRRRLRLAIIKMRLNRGSG